MTNRTILHINSSGRQTGSVTRKVSEFLVNLLAEDNRELSLVRRDLATGLPFVDEQWIEANFTKPESRSQTHIKTLSFSDSLVAELQSSEHIVIATPIYNFSIPAVLKAWIDMIARVKLTFHYTANGPVGLLQDKKAYLVIASGGVPIGGDMDFASSYLKHVLGFVGLTDVSVIDASNIDIDSGVTLSELMAETTPAFA